MTVWKPNNSSKYVFRYQIRGVTYRGPTDCTDKRSALRIEREHRDGTLAMLRRAPSPAHAKDDMSVLQAVSDYIDIQRDRDDIDKTTLAYEENAFKFIVTCLGPDTPVRSITTDDVATLVAKRRMEYRRNSKGKVLLDQDGQPQRLEGSYVNRYTWKLFRRVHNTARRKNWSPVQIIDWSDKRICLKEGGARKREMRLEEEAMFLAGLDATDGYAAVFRFAILSGLRLENFSALPWSAIDFGNREISLIQKGGRYHGVKIDDEMLELLMAQQGKHPSLVWTYTAQRGRRDNTNVTERTRGDRYPITRAGFESWYRRRARKLGFDTTIHDLRRTAGGRLLRATGNLKAVSLRLGHSDIAITARHYAHIQDDEMLVLLNRANSVTNERKAALVARQQNGQDENSLRVV